METFASLGRTLVHDLDDAFCLFLKKLLTKTSRTLHYTIESTYAAVLADLHQRLISLTESEGNEAEEKGKGKEAKLLNSLLEFGNSIGIPALGGKLHELASQVIQSLSKRLTESFEKKEKTPLQFFPGERASMTTKQELREIIAKSLIYLYLVLGVDMININLHLNNYCLNKFKKKVERRLQEVVDTYKPDDLPAIFGINKEEVERELQEVTSELQVLDGLVKELDALNLDLSVEPSNSETQVEGKGKEKIKEKV